MMNYAFIHWFLFYIENKISHDIFEGEINSLGMVI